jgi:uncharacterized membrane protein YfcA
VRPLDPPGSGGRDILGSVHAWGRWLQARQPIALVLVIGGLTGAMVGGVLNSWPAVALGLAGMFGVLVPMALARRSASPRGGP